MVPALSGLTLAALATALLAAESSAALLSAADSARAGLHRPPLQPMVVGTMQSTLPAPRPAGVQIDDGSWSIISPPPPLPPTPDQHVGIFDTTHNQMVVYGGFGLVDATWALDLNTLTWGQVNASNPPSQRWGASAIYDPVGDRLVMFGGYADLQYSPELWILPLHGPPVWAQVPYPFGGAWPPGRLFQSAIYDPVRYRMIVFGGEDGPSLNDTWALDLSSMTWSQLAAEGVAPSPRFGHSAIYDPAGDEMIVYGGNGGGENGTYALSLGEIPTWRLVPTTGGPPLARTYHTAVLDSRQERMIVHGGASGSYFEDTWELTLGPTPTWTQLAPAGAPAVARYLHNAIYDDAAASMFVFGGRGTGDLRKLTWSQATISNQIIRIDPSQAAITDTVTIRGIGLSNPMSVKFNGTDGYVISSSNYSIVAIVPAGVTNGPVTVTLATQTLTSPADFSVVPKPVIQSATPTAGGVGTSVQVFGTNFTGVTRVSFGPSGHEPFTVVSDGQINAIVDGDAQSGPIRIFTPFTSGSSTFDFTVVHHPPIIAVVAPIHGFVGQSVTVTGQYFSSVTFVAFGPNSQASYVIVSDNQLTATVDGNATSAPITISNFDGATTTTFPFQVDVPQREPAFVSVRDAPNDQGGKVILEWLASGYDIGIDHSVHDYRIWRRAPLMSTAVEPARAARPMAGAPEGFWEAVGDVPAARFQGYAFTAATVQDSLPGSNPYTAFVVQPLFNDPNVIVFSDPDSGYSVDNLSPPMPAPFSVVYGGSTTTLHWTPSNAPDFAEFKLYRGASADFVPGASNLVVATQDTNFVDIAGQAVYKLAAIDLHGNHSKYAVVSPAQTTAVLATLSSVDAQKDRIRLSWIASGEPSLNATLYRATPGSNWARIATLTATGGGLLQYEDRAVTQGGLYGYRLGIMDAGVEVFVCEVWAS
ncbi:MAG: Kelch repeat-containing protein, partial [Candidatus Eiseniibacteriota bacterium]